MTSPTRSPPSTRQRYRFSLPGIEYADDYSEAEAASSPFRPSSPPELPTPTKEELRMVAGFDDDIPEDDEDDEDFLVKLKRASPMSTDQKVLSTLEHMRSTYSRFSFYQFASGLFLSKDSDLKAAANMFYAENSHLSMMDVWWDACGGLRDDSLVEWVMDKAAAICEREADYLSSRASEGPHAKAVKQLRLPADEVTAQTVAEFDLKSLASVYARLTPHFSKMVRAFTSPPPGYESGRNRDFGRIMITSMALNLRSMKLNYHQGINSLILWDGSVPKRLVQMMNQYGICSSYPYQIRAVAALSKSSQANARIAANDPSKIKMLPYDNFNWVSRAWEASASHKTQTHDQVSALLVILPTPPEKTAAEVTSIGQFKEKAGSRHLINPRDALSDILPSSSDHRAFRENASMHVQTILVDILDGLDHLRSTIPKFTEANPIAPIKTEEHYLPTFDQEQGSTRGNMIVLEHYWTKVLGIPKAAFEDTMYTVLGDRLTVARDRAAQDQRAVDLSPHAFDHFSSFSMVGGLMHYEMNFIAAFAGNSWGTSWRDDAKVRLPSDDVICPFNLVVA